MTEVVKEHETGVAAETGHVIETDPGIDKRRDLGTGQVTEVMGKEVEVLVQKNRIEVTHEK